MPEGVTAVGGLCRNAEADERNKLRAGVGEVVYRVGGDGNGAEHRPYGKFAREQQKVHDNAHGADERSPRASHRAVLYVAAGFCKYLTEKLSHGILHIQPSAAVGCGSGLYRIEMHGKRSRRRDRRVFHLVGVCAAVLPGRTSAKSCKGTVKCALRVEADIVGYLRYRHFGVAQQAARLRNAQRIDVIVEPDPELARKQVRNIIFVEVQLAFEHFERKVGCIVLRAVVHDLAYGARIAELYLVKGHHRQKLTEKRRKITALHLLTVFSLFVFTADSRQSFHEREKARHIAKALHNG